MRGLTGEQKLEGELEAVSGVSLQNEGEQSESVRKRERKPWERAKVHKPRGFG